MSADNDKIKDRVRKLLNLANDAGAFEGEIDNALRFARRLMLEHNITENDLGKPLDPHEEAARAEYAQADAFTHGENLSLWESTLMSAVCRLIGTVSSYRTRDKFQKKTGIGTLSFGPDGQPLDCTRIVFYGPLEDAKDACSLFHEWTHVIASMGRLKFGGCFRGDGRSYCEGFSRGLLEIVTKIKEEERREISYESTGRALVLRGSLDLMKAKKMLGKQWLLKSQGIKLRHTSRQGNRNNGEAFGAGMADGRKSNFSRARTLKIGRG